MIKPQLFDVMACVNGEVTVLGQTAFEHVEFLGIWDMWADAMYGPEEVYKEGEPRHFFGHVDAGGVRWFWEMFENSTAAEAYPWYSHADAEFWIQGSNDELDRELFHPIHHYIKEHTNA